MLWVPLKAFHADLMLIQSKIYLIAMQKFPRRFAVRSKVAVVQMKRDYRVEWFSSDKYFHYLAFLAPMAVSE